MNDNSDDLFCILGTQEYSKVYFRDPKLTKIFKIGQKWPKMDVFRNFFDEKLEFFEMNS